jgi:hypothetical protein
MGNICTQNLGAAKTTNVIVGGDISVTEWWDYECSPREGEIKVQLA